jgi:hypothetical protein
LSRNQISPQDSLSVSIVDLLVQGFVLATVDRNDRTDRGMAHQGNSSEPDISSQSGLYNEIAASQHSFDPLDIGGVVAISEPMASDALSHHRAQLKHSRNPIVVSDDEDAAV